MTAVDPLFRYPIRLSQALGYDEPEGEKKSQDDIASDLDYRDAIFEDFISTVSTGVSESAVWNDYTPTFANFTSTSAVITRGRYKATATTVIVQVMVTLGASSAMGTAPTVSLPIASAATGGTSGVATYLDGTTGYAGSVWVDGSDSTAGLVAAAGPVTALVPFTWGSGDSFRFSIEYERG